MRGLFERGIHVIYVHKKSDTINRYLSNLKTFKTLNNQNSLLPYFKMYDGRMKNNKGRLVFVKFYDEREWRFLPSTADLIDFSGFDEEEIRNTRLQHENDQLITNSNK